MNIQLRPYQENLKNKTREAFKRYKRVIMLAPCRSRKDSNCIINNARFYNQRKESVVYCAS